MLLMRAKIKVASVKATEYGEVIEANPVCGALDKDGFSEDNTYSKYTPSGSLTLTVNNPALTGRIKPGQTFYVDFTLVE